MLEPLVCQGGEKSVIQMRSLHELQGPCHVCHVSFLVLIEDLQPAIKIHANIAIEYTVLYCY